MIIKARFLKDGEPSGREYSYISDIPVRIGDTVMLNETSKGIITAVDVPEGEVAEYRDRLKKIVGMAEQEKENV